MPRLELSVRNASAIATNLLGLSGRAKGRVRRVVRENGEFCKELTQLYSSRDTGFMEEHVKTVYSPEGLTFETGWDVMDFVQAGLPPYFFSQEYGWDDPRTGIHHPGVFMLTRAYEETVPQLREDLRQAVRGAVRGRNS